MSRALHPPNRDLSSAEAGAFGPEWEAQAHSRTLSIEEDVGRGGDVRRHPTLTVWYNTRCPVCDAGINGQRRKLVELVKDGRVVFRDINLEPEALKHFGTGLEDIRRRLHATDSGGRLVTGADVMVALWRITPGQRWLAAVFGNPLALPVTRFGYDRFADLLYAWNRRKGHW